MQFDIPLGYTQVGLDPEKYNKIIGTGDLQK